MDLNRLVQTKGFQHFVVFTTFALVNYFLISKGDIEENCESDALSSFYHTAKVHTSLGFSDTAPSSGIAKLSTAIHSLLVFALITGIITLGATSPRF